MSPFFPGYWDKMSPPISCLCWTLGVNYALRGQMSLFFQGIETNFPTYFMSVLNTVDVNISLLLTEPICDLIWQHKTEVAFWGIGVIIRSWIYTKLPLKWGVTQACRLNSSKDVTQVKSGNINLKIVSLWENRVQRWRKFFEIFSQPLVNCLHENVTGKDLKKNIHIWTNDQYSRPTSIKNSLLADRGDPKYTLRHGLGWSFI